MMREENENTGDLGVRSADRAWEGVNEAFPRVAACLKESGGIAWDSCKAGANKVAGGPIKFISDTANSVYDKAKAATSSAVNKVKAAGTKVFASVHKAGSDAYNSVAAVGNGVKNSIKGSLKLATKGVEESTREEEA